MILADNSVNHITS